MNQWGLSSKSNPTSPPFRQWYGNFSEIHSLISNVLSIVPTETASTATKKGILKVWISTNLHLGLNAALKSRIFATVPSIWIRTYHWQQHLEQIRLLLLLQEIFLHVGILVEILLNKNMATLSSKPFLEFVDEGVGHLHHHHHHHHQMVSRHR